MSPDTSLISGFHGSIARHDFKDTLPQIQSDLAQELKAGPFKPEYAGKLNFYLSAVDDLFRHQSDQPTTGILLCKSKNDIVVEYANWLATYPASYKSPLKCILKNSAILWWQRASRCLPRRICPK
ncbi:MAG: DUF1016 family protein [Kofleriaceae bacterium]|nr:DUF1016 family protein [Kofleriaceae bacterium]